MIRRSLLIAFLPLVTLTTPAQSPVRIQLQQFATGLTRITDIVHTDDDRLFAVLQAGTIRIVQADGSVLPTPFLNITSRVQSASNEQGLLGMTFDPDYATNGYFYVYYINGSGSGTSRVSRFSVTADPNVADPNSEVILLTRQQPYSNHNGGDLEFGPDGYLYISLGDGGNAGDPQGFAQNMTTTLGKMLRIDVHGGSPYAIPSDNPYAGSTTVLPEIWATGLRNPWRFGFDALTGDLWIGDVGQNAREEVNFWPAGNNSGPNFGWRCREGNQAYNTSGCQPASSYVEPIQVHTTATNQWCSVIGGRVYRGTQFYRLQGRYLYTDYCLGRFFSLQPNEFGGWVSEQVLPTGIAGISCIAENRDEELFAGNSTSGILYRIVDLCPQPQPVIVQDANVLTAPEALGYTWLLDGVTIPNEVGQTLAAGVSGNYSVIADFGPNCQLLSEQVNVISTGILNDGEEGSLRVHPVPASDQLFISGLASGNSRLMLLDLTGRTMVDQQVNHSDGQTVVDVRELPSGNYILRILTTDGVETARRTVAVQR
jgi:glucose/arabinose dehydrogenase